jgi:uncharacterized surface protein with fasciclin (FAS1) repeats
MKSSLKNIISLISVAGLSLSVSLPSLAQSSPSPRDPSPAPGSGAVNQPSSGSPSAPMMGNSGQPDRQSATAATPSKSIAEIVDQNPSFEMLNALLRVAALEQPTLMSSLGGSSKYTVFAPTNQAFAALPSNAVHALVQPQNRDLLVRLLSYHVVSGTVAPTAVPVGTSYPSRNLLSDMVPAGNSSSSSRLNSNPTIRSESDINAPTNESRNAGNENTSRSGMNGSSRMDVQAGANNPAQPQSGDLNPNEPSNTVDRSQVVEPSYSNPDQRGGMSSPNRPAARPSNGSSTSSRPNNTPTIRSESDINAPTNENRNAGNENTGRSGANQTSGMTAPQSGDMNRSSSSSRSSNNPTVRSEADINAPTNENRNAGNENTSRSSMSNSSRMDVQAGANNAAQPPSGDLNPNEPSNTVDRSQVVEPSYSNPDQRSGSPANASGRMSSSNSTTGGAMAVMPDIQAKNGVIHPIDRVIIPAALQAELQRAIAADTQTASR